MRVLGIDCGAERTGFGIIDTDAGEHNLIAAGTIRTSRDASVGGRLLEIARALREVIQRHSPQCAAIEEVFCSANLKTALKLAQVRGVALLAAAEAGLELGEYSPLEVKSSVVGYGRAEKHQVQLMVRSLLSLPGSTSAGLAELDSQDACDALAVAICHANRTALLVRVR